MREIKVITARGVILTGVLFSSEKSRDADTVMIAITGIHGNFQSNPFYYNFGEVIYYLSRHHDERVYKFFLLSPANLTHMMTGVTEEEKFMISQMVWHGYSRENRIAASRMDEKKLGVSRLPFSFFIFSFLQCIYDCLSEIFKSYGRAGN